MYIHLYKCTLFTIKPTFFHKGSSALKMVIQLLSNVPLNYSCYYWSSQISMSIQF